MSFEAFRRMVLTICARAGGGIRPRFRNEDGKFMATYDDVVISASKSSKSLTVRWGSGKSHTAMVPKAVVCNA